MTNIVYFPFFAMIMFLGFEYRDFVSYQQK